jgi:myosin heavy subunit
MAKEYNIGDRLYLPVWITNKESNLVMYKDNNELVTDAKFSYVYSQGETRSGEVRYGETDLLLTAEEIYASRRMVDEVEHLTDMLDYGRKKYDEIEELKSRNAELEALLKEVMATRDEAIRQNDELRKENDNLKSDCNDWKDTADERIVAVQTLTAERDNLKADLTTQKEVNEELKGRYEELDSVNKEQAEKIRKLDKALSNLKKRNDDLQAENTNLSFQLDAKPEEEPTKTVHVILNDGTGYNFYKCTKASFDNYGNFTVLKIYRGKEYVAGFLRGDKPGNFAYWWTE